MKEKIIHYENLTFKLVVSENNQFSFWYLIPPELSEFKTDPLWHTFDPNDSSAYDDEWSTNFEGLPLKSSVFKLKTFLINEIVNFIHQCRLKWFWFKPSNYQRYTIYHLLIPKFVYILKNKTGFDWEVQKTNDYFYLNVED